LHWKSNLQISAKEMQVIINTYAAEFRRINGKPKIIKGDANGRK
jgi:hypothetical protein